MHNDHNERPGRYYVLPLPYGSGYRQYYDDLDTAKRHANIAASIESTIPYGAEVYDYEEESRKPGCAPIYRVFRMV